MLLVRVLPSLLLLPWYDSITLLEWFELAPSNVTGMLKKAKLEYSNGNDEYFI